MFHIDCHMFCILLGSGLGISIGVDLTLGHLKRLSKEPRRIEIRGQKQGSTFFVKCRQVCRYVAVPALFKGVSRRLLQTRAG
jgi:hypothetical protein